MASKNFEFLRGRHSDLLDYAAAEAYAWADPQSVHRAFRAELTAPHPTGGQLDLWPAD